MNWPMISEFRSLARTVWRGFVAAHLIRHHGSSDDVFPELAYCWCETAVEYRRVFHMPDPEWHQELIVG